MRLLQRLCMILCLSAAVHVPSILAGFCPDGYEAIAEDLNGDGKIFVGDSAGRTIANCDDICNARRGCTAFEFSEERGACGTYTHGDANIKENKNRLAEHSSWRSCVKKDRCLREAKIQYLGGDFQNMRLDSVEVCKDKCGASSRCKFWTWSRPWCFLKTSKNGRIKKHGRISGSKHCGKVDGGWSIWSACSRTCGGGQQSRTCTSPSRTNGGEKCKGISIRDCNTAVCPINGGFSQWSNFGACSKTCGDGTKTRSRTCSNPRPQHNGRNCDGDMEDTRACNLGPCAINGGFSEWSIFGACSKTCGDGTKTRSRTCTKPRPQHNGLNCNGDTEDTRACNLGPCAINGGFSEWSNFGACSKTCGDGTKTRSRTCTNPRPQHNGLNCDGDMEDTRACNLGQCGVIFGPPLNIENMDSTRTKKEFPTIEQLEIIKKCRFNFQIMTDVRFRMQRDDSESESFITYWRPGINEVQTFSFTGGYADHTRVEFDGEALTCLGPKDKQDYQCKSLEEGVPTKAVILSIDFNPRKGSARHNAWSRNRYSLYGSYYNIKCSSETCPEGYDPISNNLDGTGATWNTEYPKDPKEFKTIHECAAICDARSGCTGFESGEGRCGTYTGGNSNILEDANRLDEDEPWRSCLKKTVAVDCQWSEYSDWSPCSTSCGDGNRQRTRYVKTPAKDGGNPCVGEKVEREGCNAGPCTVPVDCQWSEYSDWSPCSASCGDGNRQRTRYVKTPAKDGGNPCVGDKEETEGCNAGPCAGSNGGNTQPAVHGMWSEWGSCSKSCGNDRVRTRTCTNPPPAHGGKDCEGKATEDCVSISCAAWDKEPDAVSLDDEWCSWDYWGDCSTTCGKGVQTRNCTCPSQFATYCEGPNSKSCNEDKPCVRHGGWSDWTECDTHCNGKQWRFCNTPFPGPGGNDCYGRNTAHLQVQLGKTPEINSETRECNQTSCGGVLYLYRNKVQEQVNTQPTRILSRDEAILNERVKSVNVTKGNWELYTKTHYQGERMRLKEGQKLNVYSDSDYNSARQTCEYSGDSELLVYEHRSSQGDEKQFLREMEDLHSINWGDKITSVHAKKHDWELYSEPKYSGNRFIIKEGVQKDVTPNAKYSSLRPICETYTHRCKLVRLEIVGDADSLRKHKGAKIIGASSGLSCSDPSKTILALGSTNSVTQSISLGTSQSDEINWNAEIGLEVGVTGKLGFLGSGTDVTASFSASAGAGGSFTVEKSKEETFESGYEKSLESSIEFETPGAAIAFGTVDIYEINNSDIQVMGHLECPVGKKIQKKIEVSTMKLSSTTFESFNFFSIYHKINDTNHCDKPGYLNKVDDCIKQTKQYYLDQFMSDKEKIVHDFKSCF